MLELLIAASLGAVSPTDFCILAAEEQGTGLAIVHPDGRLAARVQVGSWPHEVEVSGDGQTAYVSQFGITDYDSRIGTPGDHVSRIDLVSAKETGRYELPAGLRAPHGVKLRPKTNELFVNAEAGGDTMLIYDAESLRLLRRFPLQKGSHNFIFSLDGRFVFVFAGTAGVAKYDALTGEVIAEKKLETPIRGLRLAPSGKIAAAAKGEVALLDPETLNIEQRLSAPVTGQLVYLEALTDGTFVAPSIADNGVVWYEPSKPPRFIQTGKGALNVRIGPDARLYVANVDDDHLTILDTRGSVLGRVGHNIAGPNGLAFGVCPLANAERG